MNELPRPPVVGRCKVCEGLYPDWFAQFTVVSPAGIEHMGLGSGETECGKDATGDAWWWPL